MPFPYHFHYRLEVNPKQSNLATCWESDVNPFQSESKGNTSMRHVHERKLIICLDLQNCKMLRTPHFSEQSPMITPFINILWKGIGPPIWLGSPCASDTRHAKEGKMAAESHGIMLNLGNCSEAHKCEMWQSQSTPISPSYR